MKRLIYNKVNDLSQLHDEILAARPELRPSAGVARMTVEGKNGEIFLTVPDDADEAALASLIAAHVPVPRPPPADLKAIVAAINAVDFESSTTLADMRTKCIQLRNRTVLAFREVWHVFD